MRLSVRRAVVLSACAAVPVMLAMMVPPSGGAEAQETDAVASEAPNTNERAKAPVAEQRAPERFGNLTVTYGRYDPGDLPDDLADVASEAAGLADDNAGEIAGSWYDAATGSVSIAPTTERGRQLAEQFATGKERVTVVSREFTHIQLKEAGRTLVDEVPVLRTETQVLGVDAKTGGIFLEVATELPDLKPVITAVEALPFPVELRVTGDIPLKDQTIVDDSRRHDESPYSGGLGYSMGHNG